MPQTEDHERTPLELTREQAEALEFHLRDWLEAGWERLAAGWYPGNLEREQRKAAVFGAIAAQLREEIDEQ